MPNILGTEGRGAKFAGYLTFLAWVEFGSLVFGQCQNWVFPLLLVVGSWFPCQSCYLPHYLLFFGGGGGEGVFCLFVCFSCSFRPLATARKKKALPACVSHFVAIGVVVTEGLWLLLSDTSVKIPSVKPVLNWANVCSPNILRTLRRTMIRFTAHAGSSEGLPQSQPQRWPPVTSASLPYQPKARS